MSNKNIILGTICFKPLDCNFNEKERIEAFTLPQPSQMLLIGDDRGLWLSTPCNRHVSDLDVLRGLGLRKIHHALRDVEATAKILEGSATGTRPESRIW